MKSILLEELFRRTYWDRAVGITDMILERYYPTIYSNQVAGINVVTDIKESPYIQRFISLMNEISVEHLYVSYVHGQNHVERVAVLSAWLAITQKLPEELFTLCVECAKYHDIGRIGDGEDFAHGMRGAERIEEVCGKYETFQKKMIAAIIAAHSLEDTYAETMLVKFGVDVKMKEDGLRLLRILKDADALDRFRLNNNSLRVNMLRNNEARRLVRAACEMVNL